jgi:hypothetical protein
MTTHAALANRLAWMQREYGLRPGEAVLHKTPVSFDVAGWELLWPLTVGATVVLARPEGHRDPYYLARLIARHRVTTCHFVPSMLHAFLEEPAAGMCARVLRRVVCSGEELPPALAERFAHTLPGVELHNLYGPTEAAIDVSAHRVGTPAASGMRVPIGRPIAGTRLYVLDAAGHVAPPQAPGELHIAGLAPARGYLGRPGLTAERFVPDPFVPGARLYRTGDLARYLTDGSLEYLGRLDRQLKIRGQRVEPAEIEIVLNSHPAVELSAVVARPGPDGRLRLAAWAVPARSAAPDPGELRDFLARRLPPGLVPETVGLLAELPVGPHGKLAPQLLPDPVAEETAHRVGGGPRTAPRDAVEYRMAGIWTEVLGIRDPSVTDDFFALGGHSLLATRVAVRVRASFGVELRRAADHRAAGSPGAVAPARPGGPRGSGRRAGVDLRTLRRGGRGAARRRLARQYIPRHPPRHADLRSVRESPDSRAGPPDAIVPSRSPDPPEEECRGMGTPLRQPAVRAGRRTGDDAAARCGLRTGPRTRPGAGPGRRCVGLGRRRSDGPRRDPGPVRPVPAREGDVLPGRLCRRRRGERS